MKNKFTMLLSMCGVLLFGMPTYAQKQTQEKVRPEKADQDFVDHTYKPLTLKLNDDGSKYIRFLLWNQMWARVIQNNPGTLDVAGSPQSTTTDIGIRRARVLAYAEISPRFLILILSHFVSIIKPSQMAESPVEDSQEIPAVIL